MNAQHEIYDIELTKNNHQGDCLTFTADGEEINVTGEFFVDRNGQLHHTHIFPDGEEVEITIPYNN